MATDFGIMLREIGGGVYEEAGEEMTDLVAALYRRAEADGSASGTLTLKLGLKAERNKGEIHIVVKPDIIAKKPPPERAKGRFYACADGDLSTKNPRQSELDFKPKAIDGGKSETPRVVASEKTGTKAL
jgi:hypothetical protein